jgi:SAM-dependent methyltransferase
VIVCPDCDGELAAVDVAVCTHCGRAFERRDGVPELVARSDLESMLFRAYLEHYARLAADDLEQSIQLEDHHRIETERLRDLLGDVRGLDVCDVGAGKGVLLRGLLGRGAASLTGIEIAEPYLRRLSTEAGVRLVAANAERLPFREEFDVVVSADVLEHVLNPGDLLLSVRRALRADGRFVVRVPYRDNLVAYAVQSGYRYPFVHLRSFDRRGLRDLLRQAGFDVRRWIFSSFYAGKLRRALSGHPRVERRVRLRLEKHFGGAGRVTCIDPRIGRLLMRPNTLTAVAVRRKDIRERADS